MITSKNFTSGATYPPIEESVRLGKILDNRKLYNNDLTSYLKTDSNDNSIHLNLFRKAIDVYVNFLLSEGIVVDVFNDRLNHLLDVLYLVNTDSKRYGTGVVTLDQETGLFKVYEPDQWYQIMGKTGTLDAEVLVEYSNNPLEVDKQGKSNSFNFNYITIIKNFYNTGIQVKEVRELKGGQIGKLVGSPIKNKIVGRQVATLFNGYAKGQEGLSIFDDIKDIVVDMVRIKQSLSKSIERNSRPHLVAPASILTENANKNIDIDTNGMLFPVEPNDAAPFYLQWDTNAEASKFQIQEHWNSYFALTSIPKMIFDPSTGGMNTSGEALKRILFPFLSSLSKLRTANISLIKQLLVIYDNYLLANGLQRLETTAPEIEIPYDRIFEDTDTVIEPTKEDINSGL